MWFGGLFFCFLTCIDSSTARDWKGSYLLFLGFHRIWTCWVLRIKKTDLTFLDFGKFDAFLRQLRICASWRICSSMTTVRHDAFVRQWRLCASFTHLSVKEDKFECLLLVNVPIHFSDVGDHHGYCDFVRSDLERYGQNGLVPRRT